VRRILATVLLVALVGISSWGQEHIYVPNTPIASRVDKTYVIANSNGTSATCVVHTSAAQFQNEPLSLTEAASDPLGMFDVSSQTMCYRGTRTITAEITAFINVVWIAGAPAVETEYSFGKEQEGSLPLGNTDEVGLTVQKAIYGSWTSRYIALGAITTLDEDDCIGLVGKTTGTGNAPQHRTEGIHLTIREVAQ
jgi:hypothetical protein